MEIRLRHYDGSMFSDSGDAVIDRDITADKRSWREAMELFQQVQNS
jgi:hypothetical protein